jgi:hypothetical protein
MSYGHPLVPSRPTPGRRDPWASPALQSSAARYGVALQEADQSAQVHSSPAGAQGQGTRRASAPRPPLPQGTARGPHLMSAVADAANRPRASSMKPGDCMAAAAGPGRNGAERQRSRAYSQDDRAVGPGQLTGLFEPGGSRGQRPAGAGRGQGGATLEPVPQRMRSSPRCGAPRPRTVLGSAPAALRGSGCRSRRFWDPPPVREFLDRAPAACA